MPVQNNNQNRKGRKGRRRFGTTIPNQLYATSFPRETKVTMRYFELISTTLGTVLPTETLYNLNSIYDPNRSGTGHQPQGHDQWANFYNRYRVDACKVSLTLTCTSDMVWVSLLGNNSTALINSANIVSESPMSIIGATSSGARPITLTYSYNLADLNGVTRQVYNADDRYAAPFGSDPSEALILHISIADSAFVAARVDYFIMLEFDVTLFDPVQLPIS